MQWKRSFWRFSAILLLTGLITPCHAQELGELQWEELPLAGEFPDSPTVSLLIVESTVPGLGFSSRRPVSGILKYDNPEPGIYHVILAPGVDHITINVKGYLPLDLGRYNYKPKGARKIKVTAKRIVEGEGTLEIRSTPPGASISLNDVMIAEKTPVMLPKRKTGGYRIVLSGVDGYAEVETTAVVRKNETTTMQVALARMVAGLRIASDPPGATVYWNGDEIGRTPLNRQDLRPGEGVITCVLKDYITANIGARLEAGKTREENVILVRETGRIKVESLDGTEIELDGTSVGQVSAGELLLEKIPTGSHRLHASLAGYKDAETTVTVEAERTAQVTLNPIVIPGSIFVTSTPSGARILLDGRTMGIRTPGKLEQVDPGPHRVSLQLPGFTGEAKSVTVEAAKTTTVDIVLREQQGGTNLTKFALPEGVLGEEFIEPTLQRIKELKLAINEAEQNLESRIQEEVAALHQTDPDFAPKDPFESSSEYESRKKRAEEKERQLRGRLQSDVAADLKEELDSLKTVEYATTALELNLDPQMYDADRELWPIAITYKDNTIDDTLKLSGQKARQLYNNRDNMRITGYLKIDGGETYLSRIELRDNTIDFVFYLGDIDFIQGLPRGMNFVEIPAGVFIMGSPSSEKGHSYSESPQHKITLNSYYMMTTEVTQAQWKAVMGNNPSKYKGNDRPIERVSWNDVQEFIRKLNDRDPGKGYRLPTEAEWEYACRAGTISSYYSGEKQFTLYRVGWYRNNSGGRTHQVGQKLPNAWGLYDMHGNVWEWCADTYHEDYNGAPTDGSAWLDPFSTTRVLRGGSWYRFSKSCRSANRSKSEQMRKGSEIGFRLVCRNP